jgi:UDP-N-acetylmuramate dehydrogenase
MPSSADWEFFRRQREALVADSVTAVEGEPLAPRTTLRIGGPARVLLRCATREGVVAALRAVREAGVPWLVLGLGANVLVPDDGLDAVVLTLVGDIASISLEGTRIRAGAGAQLARVVRESLSAGLAGVECLGGIPSTVGGALAMNAGAYGQEILDVLAWVEVVEEDLTVRRLERWECTGVPVECLGRDGFVTSVELALRAEDPRCCGSTFGGLGSSARGRSRRSRRPGACSATPPGTTRGGYWRSRAARGCAGAARRSASATPT